MRKLRKYRVYFSGHFYIEIEADDFRANNERVAFAKNDTTVAVFISKNIAGFVEVTP